MNTDLDAQDEALRREADALLARNGVLEILAEFGTPHISGSYSLRLMTWRDLDIYLETPSPDAVAFVRLGVQLAEALRPRKMSFTDHLNFPATEPVTGLYWGIQAQGWKLDLWAVTPEVCAERLAQCAAIGARLTAETRAAILAIKNEVCRLPEYRKSITSQHIYDAVLDSGSRSVADFWRLHCVL